MTTTTTPTPAPTTASMTTVHQVPVPGRGSAPVAVTDRGQGHPFLLLHGGAGPRSMAGFAQTLADQRPARVLSPLHPGFDGTLRPAWLDDVRGLAAL